MPCAIGRIPPIRPWRRVWRRLRNCSRAARFSRTSVTTCRTRRRKRRCLPTYAWPMTALPSRFPPSMKVARFLEEAAEFDPVAVTIGNFDGVHIGHRQLLHEVMRAAEEKGVRPAVLTFDPHPASIVAPQRAARLLTTHAERCAMMARAGIEYVLVLPFTKEISRWTPEQFVERILLRALRARVVVVGGNFLFGHDQAGNTAVMSELGGRFGFETRIVPPVRRRGRLVSSSEIRRAIEAGKVGLAAGVLARPDAPRGGRRPGPRRGREQKRPHLESR